MSGSVNVSARTEYAVRAAIGLAAGSREDSHTARQLADSQHIPHRFLLNILADLRRHRIVTSRRGPDGGWRLARPAETITLADIVQAVDGPLSERTASTADAHAPAAARATRKDAGQTTVSGSSRPPPNAAMSSTRRTRRCACSCATTSALNGR